MRASCRSNLKLGLDRLVFVTAYSADIADQVANNPSYLKPGDGRQHFHWSDFWSLLEKSTNESGSTVLNDALFGLFAHFGFDPPRPEIGDLSDPDEGRRKENRENFAKLWNLTRAGLEEREWENIRDLHINLPQQRHNLLRLIPLPRHDRLLLRWILSHST